MTTFAAAEKALIDEVENRIQTLVPNVESAVRFKPITDTVRELRGKKASSPKMRSFEIGAAEWVGRTQVGAGYTMATYNHEIRIYYPSRGRKYNNLAMSDADQIDRLLLNNGAALSGVQNRRLDPETAFTLEKDEDDNFQTLIMTLMVMYETTAT